MPDETTTLAASPTDAPASGGDTARPLAERQIEALGELVEIGVKIARAIGRRVDADVPDPVADLNAAAIAYARVARAVRQTVMLQDRLLAERAAATARAGDLRARVSRIVRRAIEGEHADAERVERLATEAAEGLEQERYGDILTRPIGEIVADICKALGLRPDWDDLFDDISAAEAFARGKTLDIPDAPLTGPLEVRWLDDDDDEPGSDSS